MKRATLPQPPDPSNPNYIRDPLAYNRAMFEWANQLCGKLEQASDQNDSPLNQNFVITSFTTNTALAGTSTTTDIANFVCTLVQAFTDKGMITNKSFTS